jgi:hypothetical protein
LNSIDAGLRDRSTCIFVPPSSALDWLARAQFILHAEGVHLPDAQVMNVLHTQLQISNSNRKLLERLEDLVQIVRANNTSSGQGGGDKPMPPPAPTPTDPNSFNPLAAITA